VGPARRGLAVAERELMCFLRAGERARH
jgi:hypothetical protein